MIRVTASAEIAAPIERVWRLYDDLPNTPTWVPFVENVLSIEGGPGVGTAYRERTRLGGVTGVQEWRITASEPPRRTVHESVDMEMDARLTITFRSIGQERTLVRQQTELRSRLPRPIRWLHEALFAAVSRSGVHAAVQGAKRHLEA